AFRLAPLATLRLVLEVLVGEELLFSSRPDELRAAIHAPEDPVLELHRSPPRRGRSACPLLQLPPELLPIPLPRERLFRAPLVARLQVERMLLDVLDDVFLLNLALEPTESALDRFALLDFHFRHVLTPPSRVLSPASRTRSRTSRTAQI